MRKAEHALLWLSLFSMIVPPPGLSWETKPWNACNSVTPETSAQICWQNNLGEGCNQARSDHKRVLVDVYTNRCGWCTLLERSTYVDPVLVQFLKKEFICVKVTGDSGQQGRHLARTYGIKGFPCIVVLEPNGREVGKFYGYRNPQNFVFELKRIMGVTPTDSGCAPGTLQQGPAGSLRTAEQTPAAPVRRAEPLSDDQRGPNNLELAKKLVSEAQSYLRQGASVDRLSELNESEGLVVKSGPERAAVPGQSVSAAINQGRDRRLYGQVSVTRYGHSDGTPARLDRDVLISPPFILGLQTLFTNPANESVFRRDLTAAEEQAAKGVTNSGLVVEAADRLAFNCAYQGKLSEAERFYKRAIEALETAPRLTKRTIEAPETTTNFCHCWRLNACMHNLAVVYGMEGKFAEAERFCSQVLAERAGDTSDRSLADNLYLSAWRISDLAMLSEGEHDYVRAERLYKKSLAILEALVGPDNRCSSWQLRYLATFYEKQGRHVEVEELHQRLLATTRDKVR